MHPLLAQFERYVRMLQDAPCGPDRVAAMLGMMACYAADQRRLCVMPEAWRWPSVLTPGA